MTNVIYFQENIIIHIQNCFNFCSKHFIKKSTPIDIRDNRSAVRYPALDSYLYEWAARRY